MPDTTATIVGGLTRDPELRYTQGGRGVASIGVAASHRYQKNGEWVEETSFFNVSAWGTLGENAAASLTKGMRVIVTGRLQQRSYETAAGEKRSVVEIIADEIGPSLKWATASVEKNARNENGGGGNYGGQSNSNSGGQSRRPAGASVPDQDRGHDAFGPAGDEEPF